MPLIPRLLSLAITSSLSLFYLTSQGGSHSQVPQPLKYDNQPDAPDHFAEWTDGGITGERMDSTETTETEVDVALAGVGRKQDAPDGPGPAGEHGHGQKDTAIVTTDTRALHVPLDPAEFIPSWTLAALNNHLYAEAIGASFTYHHIPEKVSIAFIRPTSSLQRTAPDVSPMTPHPPVLPWGQACSLPSRSPNDARLTSRTSYHSLPDPLPSAPSSLVAAPPSCANTQLIDGKRPESAYQPTWDGYCHHRTYGWRPAHFCKMPYVWYTLEQRPEVESLVYIDSDALFRSPNISVHRHLDQLSPERPFGVLTNRPYDHGPCSGYWFMSREETTGSTGSTTTTSSTSSDLPSRTDPFDSADSSNSIHTDHRRGLPATDNTDVILNADAAQQTQRTGRVEDFVLEWWNEDWKDTSMMWRDQATLRRLIGGDYPGGKVLDEGSFELTSPDQMLQHVGHKVLDRAEQLAALWTWKDKYPLNDRLGLRRLLLEVDVRVVDPGEITGRMPLPGERTF